jgi:hypothetical protein
MNGKAKNAALVRKQSLMKNILGINISRIFLKNSSPRPK